MGQRRPNRLAHGELLEGVDAGSREEVQVLLSHPHERVMEALETLPITPAQKPYQTRVVQEVTPPVLVLGGSN